MMVEKHRQNQPDKHHNESIFLILVAYVVLSFSSFVGSAYGQRVAFFPLLDLTLDYNGINRELTTITHQELSEYGLQLVSQEDIMSFLVKHRVRRLGLFNNYLNSLIQKELSAHFVLLGAICQKSLEGHLSLSMNLQLSRTSDRKIVWARTQTLSSSDFVSLLGLNNLTKLEDMYDVFFAELFAGMPKESDIGEERLDNLNIATVSIRPKYLRTGERVTCTIKLNSSMKAEGDGPFLYIRIGDEKHPLMLLEEDDSVYQTSWSVLQKEGNYPVTLLAEWPNSVSQKRIIGSYSIDEGKPVTKLVAVGKEYDSRILFSDKLVIVPKLVEPEIITRWQIEVFDEEDEAVVIMSETGQIPHDLTWEGKTSLGNSAESGEYRIVFKVWDRAERTSSAEVNVWYLPEPPELLFDVVRQEKKITVGVDNVTETPLSFWWAKFFREDGSLLKLAQGTDFPTDIELEGDLLPDEKIECLISARDILGNQSKQLIPNVLQLAEKDVSEKENVETEWVQEF